MIKGDNSNYWLEILSLTNPVYGFKKNKSLLQKGYLESCMAQGTIFVYQIRRRIHLYPSVDFYICSNNKEKNIKIFKYLQKHRKDIEKDFGSELNWKMDPTKHKSYRVYYSFKIHFNDEAQREKLKREMVVKMAKLVEVFSKHKHKHKY